MSENIQCPKCEELNSFTHIYCFNCGANLNDKKDSSFMSTIKFILTILKEFYFGIINHLYLFLLFVSIGYFIIYVWLVYFNNNEVQINKPFLDFGKDIAVLIFSAGIFTSSLKYLQYLKVFESEFHKILFSDKYNLQIKKNIESITLSEDFFLRQNNLEGIWQTVTLSKYKKEFPELYDNIRINLKNELFEGNNIAYYYKNVQKTYNIKLLDDNCTIEITEDTKYTIVRNSIDSFHWDCKLKVYKEDSDQKKYPIIEFEVLNDPTIVFNPEKDIDTREDDCFIIKKLDRVLTGKKEYHIKRSVTLRQNLKNDREYSFGSDRIIDDLSIRIRYSKDLNVFFSPITKVKFVSEITEDLGDMMEKKYLNRELMLPGEKFKLFFIKSK